jgi:hypothetical protein
MQVLSVSKGERQLETKTIIVRRAGGTVSIEGRQVKGTESDFPAFEMADEYILFLKPAAEGHYTVLYGPHGAFKIEEGKVTQVLDGEWNRERGRVELSQFLEEIATTLVAQIPERAQWEITFSQVEAAAGLSDMRAAPRSRSRLV